GSGGVFGGSFGQVTERQGRPTAGLAPCGAICGRGKNGPPCRLRAGKGNERHRFAALDFGFGAAGFRATWTPAFERDSTLGNKTRHGSAGRRYELELRTNCRREIAAQSVVPAKARFG